MTTTAALAARVLIVDDDAALLQALPEALRLRMPGVTVDTCESAACALDLVAATDYDAIVSDIKMPGMDGLALLPEIRVRRPDTPTLLITGHGEHDLAVQALRGGAFDFIQKPIDRDYFVASLSRAIRLRQLSREVDEQRTALERHAAELERTVEARTRELRAANEAQAELLVRERAARAEAEEAQRHLTSLALQLDRTLADAELLNAIAKAAAGEDDFGRILAVALDHLGRVVRFTGGSVALIEGDELVVRAAVGPFAGAALGQRLPRGKGATWRVVETGEPFRSDDVVAAGLRPTTPFRSFLAAPLVWRGRTFGLLEVDSTAPRAFADGDLALLRKLAATLSGPIELARRYAEEVRLVGVAEAARRRLAFLAGASALLAASLDYRTTLESVAHLAVSHLADWCAVNVVEEDGSFPTLAVAHADPAKAELARDLQRRYPPDPNAPYGVPNVIRTGQSELVPEITDEMLAAAAVDDEHLAIVRALGLVSYMCVPLVARGRTLGALTFASTASGRRYGPEDLALAEELGHRAAVAVDNARLYQEAQRAIGIRDQFLTVAAHELRTPITTVRGNTELLVRRVEREDVPLDRGWLAERLRRLLGGVERLHALASRVLDLNQLQAGSFDLSRGRCDLTAIVEGVVERLRPTITPGSGTTIAVERPESPVVGWWDPVRVEQVVVNLLQNAIKYQPNGGTIRVTLEATASEATLRVRDRGIGIATGDLPRLFTPYVRADTATANQIGGVGMGLYITAQLVRLHEGTIAVSSEVGVGSEFVVRLPLGEVKV